MPYSTSTLMKKSIEKKIEKYKKKIAKELENDANKLIKECNKQTSLELYEEAYKMYNDLITEYYLYETVMYSRHEVGVGTGTGANLYRGNRIRLAYNNLYIEFSGGKMRGGYEYDNRQDVLKQVMGGFRGVPGRWIEPWSGSYYGKYFSVSDVSIDRAFEIFQSQYHVLYRIIFEEKINQEIATGKYKYFK